MNMLTSLNTQLDAATQALARMEQDKSYMESMLAQQQSMSTQVTNAADRVPALSRHNCKLCKAKRSI